MKLTEIPDGIDVVRWKSDDREPWRYHYAVRVREGAGVYWHSTVGAQLHRDPESALSVSSYVRNTSPGHSEEVEPLIRLHERPGACCGACPPILGGGYDCTCGHNPRCPRYVAPPLHKRIARAIDRWFGLEVEED